MKIVVPRAWLARHLREFTQTLDERIDARRAIERRTLPVGCEIAPLNQLPAGVPQSIDRTFLLVCECAESGKDRTPKRTLDAFGRIGELFLEPGLKRGVVHPARLRFGEDLEQRIDARFDGTLAKEVGAEAVNRADLSFFELGDGGVQAIGATEVAPYRCAIGCRTSGFFEGFAESQLQLAGGFFGKGDADDFGDVCTATLDDSDDAIDQLGGFACSGRRFNDQRRIKIVRNQIAVALVGSRAILSPFMDVLAAR